MESVESKPGVARSWLRGRALVVYASVAALLLAVVLRGQTQARVTDVTLTEPGSPARPVVLPFSAPATFGHPLTFTLHVRASALTQTSFTIVPDDHLVSIEVNGENESLAGVDPKKLDDFRDGFQFPLGRHFKRGDNTIVIGVTNRGGPGGLDVRADPRDWRNVAEQCLVAAACLALLGLALRVRRASWSTVAIATAAVLLRLAYLRVTPYSVRAHDVDGHIEYIEYVLAHHAAPRIEQGYSFYHPPLYFGLSALLWRVCDALGSVRAGILVALQLESMVFALGFAAFAIATARLWLDRAPDAAFGRGLTSRKGVSVLLAALLLFWPASLMHSVRIGNDDLAYLFMGAGVYFASRWWLWGAALDANLAAVAGALGVVTKTNSLVVFALLACLLAARLVLRWRRGDAIRVKHVLGMASPALSLLFCSTSIALAKSIVAAWSGKVGNVIVANASWNPVALVVGDRPKNFLWLDLHTFVTQPFTSPWDDAFGRQYFWHFFLKTTLFGEWMFTPPWAGKLAIFLSVALLCMGAYGLVGTLVRGPAAWLDELPLVLLAGGLMTSLILLRAMLPSPSSGDFRYILPVLVPWTWWYVRSMIAYRERGWPKLAVFGGLLGWSFAAASAAFVLVVAFAGE